MSQSRRKLFGTILLLAWTVAFVLVAATLAGLTLGNASSPVQLLVAFLASLVWLGPATLIIGWMQRPDAPAA